MLDNLTTPHPAVGAAVMVLGVALIAASAMSMTGRGLGLLSSGREPWALLICGGTLLLLGRILLG